LRKALLKLDMSSRLPKLAEAEPHVSGSQPVSGNTVSIAVFTSIKYV
jgi:hypothetical protein